MTENLPMSAKVPMSVKWYDLNLKDAKELRYAKLSYCTEYAVAIDDDRDVYVCRIGTDKYVRVPINGKARAIALSEDFEFAVATLDGHIQRFDLTNPSICLGTLKAGPVTSIAYDPYGIMLVCGMANGYSNVYDLEANSQNSLIASVSVAGERAIPLIMAFKNMVIGVDRGGRIFWLRNFGKPDTDHYGDVQLDWDCWAMAKHPFSSRVVLGGSGPYVRNYVNFQTSPKFLVSSFRFIRDLTFLEGNQIAIIGNSGVDIADLEKNEVYIHLENNKGKVLCARAKHGLLKVICA